MKLFFFALAFCCLIGTAHAVDPIDGAFGLKFGEVFEPKTAPGAGPYDKDWFADAFEFNPDKPNPAFSAYFVWVSPSSHLIYKIAAVRTSADFAERKQTTAKLIAALSSKYSDDPSTYKRITQYHKSIEVNNIHGKGTEPYGLMVVYQDQDTAAKSAVEEAAIKRVELSKQQRESARAVDTTGL